MNSPDLPDRDFTLKCERCGEKVAVSFLPGGAKVRRMYKYMVWITVDLPEWIESHALCGEGNFDVVSGQPIAVEVIDKRTS